MWIILGGFRCPVILKTGPAKGVPLEQSKKAVFVKDFFRQLTFWGAGAILILTNIGACGEPDGTIPSTIQHSKGAETLQVCLQSLLLRL